MISLRWFLILLLFDLSANHVDAATGADVQARIAADMDAGKPGVVHVVVALCDNLHQGIVPVPAKIGNGQDPRSNLYWGAMYGVRSFLSMKGGWKIRSTVAAPSPGILERIVLHRTIVRNGRSRDLYVVADAWDGAEIRRATSRFLEYAAGGVVERIAIDSGKTIVEAGGAAHLVAYVGHDGLMDFSVNSVPAREGAPPRSAVVLACASRPYFAEHLRQGSSHPLLLTTGLMAPEAYVLDAVVRAWFAGRESGEVHEAAATAYNKYQKCGLKGARRLFAAAP